MKKIIPSIALFLFTSSLFSQTYKTIQITKVDGTTHQVMGKFEYDSKDFISGLSVSTDSNQEPDAYNIREIAHLDVADKKYVLQSFNRQNYLFEELIVGTLSLYKSKENYYLIKDELEVREVPFKNYNTSGKTLHYGIISVYINNCQPVQEYAYSKNTDITASVLMKIVADYNNCSKTEAISIPVQAIADSKVTHDKIGFGVSLGYAVLNTNFDNFEPNTNSNIGTPTAGAKLYVFTSALNNGLFFNFTFDYFFGKEQKVTSVITNKTQYFSTLMGINYQYKSNNKTFTPFIGINGGLVINSASNVVNDLPGNKLVYDANNLLTYNVTLGSFIHVFNQKIEAAFIYQPKMAFDIDSSSIAGDLEQSYTVSAMQFKLTYCF